MFTEWMNEYVSIMSISIAQSIHLEVKGKEDDVLLRLTSRKHCCC